MNCCTFNVDVVPAEITKVIAGEDSCLIDGRNNSLMCLVTGVPQPTVHWFMVDNDNDRRINITANSKFTIMGETLIINNVTIDDENVYGCVATNFVDGILQMDERSENFTLCGMVLYSINSLLCYPHS